ncbi:MAG: heavy-metal-associated domain-containing protein, partial [Planctomycetota bacterium]
PAKSCCNEPCKGDACAYKEAKLKKVACGVCEDTKESGSAESVAQNADDIVLNIKGMTCGGCANRVKGALTECTGVKDAQVNHKDGKAVVQVENGKANAQKLIEAVEKIGFSASECDKPIKTSTL